MRFILPAVLFSALLMVLLFGLHHGDPHHLPSPLIGKAVPPFHLSSLNQNSAPLTQQLFNGKISLLNVWASWCDACRAEHTMLMQIAQHPHLHVYGLNYKDQRFPAQKFLQILGNPFQHIIYDPNGQLAINLGVYGTPETFLIDQQGIIRYKYIGVITSQVWQQELLPQIVRLQNHL